ncbi:MAG: recombinase RecF [Novosphingobium sp. 28-62-57]|uniref:PspC domain-containing protein n=1 Tax=unclassified Novosphingobium TaxID=2644732 RepID=UPI000BDA6756|nr:MULTISPECIES: PspC domain-containing protein [unclassified Novosphingobium]OYW48111.1 MAG: recombinase RecF [Novosphingobium sp. 12-63-9]OYZ08604.1 MAG: recombinase RecF [Novosphingobium sp. 28-62-57]OZA36107.1 MAG: recombinase RecF [Novosphingobium sp. 17-62-9]HQS69698.1 PspC domain-containing protein [Novosphingobium sp.]
MSQLRFDDSAPRPLETSRGFRLDKARGKVMGVCAGISSYFGVDVTLVRVAFALATLLGLGSAIIVYLLIGLIAD